MSQIPPSITLTIRDFLDIAFRRKWFFIVPTVILSSLAFAYAYTKPAVYKSTALIVVEEEKIRTPVVAGLAEQNSVLNTLNTLLQKMMSISELEKVVDELYLQKRMPKIEDKEGIVNVIKNSLQISPKPGGVIEMNYEGPDPLVCKEILEALVNRFVNASLKVEDTQTQRGIEFIKSQIDIYRKRLEDSEKALAEFKKTNTKDLSLQTTEAIRDTIGFPGGVNINVSRLAGFEMELINLRLQLDQLLKQKESIEKQLSSEEKVIISQTVKSADPVTRELSNQIVALQVKLNSLLVDSSPDHPEVLRLEKKINNINGMLEKRSAQRVEEETYALNPVRIELQKRLNQINVEIDALKTKEKTLSIITEKFNEKVERLPDQEKEYAKLMRDYNINNGIYQNLQNKLEMAQITQRLEDSEEGIRFKLVDPPTYSKKPIKPKRKRILVLGIAAGIMVGIGCLIGVEYMDKSFRTEKGLAQLVGVPVLSSIPNMLSEQEDQLRRAKKRLTVILLGVFVTMTMIFVIIKFVLKIKK